MSDYLPARRDDTPLTAARPESNGLARWLDSPLSRALAQVLPDVIRMAERRGRAESRPLVSHIIPSSDGASGMSLSEVEVDVDAPFVRRVVIRNASSWSVAPDVLSSMDRKPNRGRWGLRALTVGLVGIAGFVLARRSGVSLPPRLNPVSSVPLFSTATSQVEITEHPGEAD